MSFILPLIGMSMVTIALVLVKKSQKADSEKPWETETDEMEAENPKRKIFGKRGKRKTESSQPSAQEFLGFKDIRNGLIQLDNGEYRMILEVKGTVNFPLLSHEEQVGIEDAFASCLSSLTFPVQFYVQSRLLDMSPTLEFLDHQLRRVPEVIRTYGTNLMQYLQAWVTSRAVMERRNYVVVGVDKTDIERSAVHLESIINGGLRRCGLEARRLTTEEILEMLYVSFNKNRANIAKVSAIATGMSNLFVKGLRNPLSKGPEVDEYGADFELTGGASQLKDIAPDGFKETEDYIRIGPRFTRVYTVIEMPPRVFIGFLDDLYSLDDVDVSFFLHPAQTHEAVIYLTKTITKLEAQRIQDEKRGDISSLSVLERAASDLWQLREKVQTNEDRIFYTSIIISVTDNSEKELDYKCKLLEARLGGRGVHVRSAFLRQAEAYKSVLPFANNQMWDIRKNFNLGAAVSIFPFVNAELAHPGGVFIGQNLFTEAPVIYDLFVGPPVVNNKHFVVMAAPGSGKSYLTKGIASRALCMGTRVVFIDPEGEYKVLTEARGGQVVSFKPGGEVLINPFDLEEEEDDEGNVSVNISEKILELKRLVKVMVEGANPEEHLTTEELAGLEIVLAGLYSERGINEHPNSLYETYSEESNIGLRKKQMPTISDLCAALEQKGYEKLGKVLMPYTSGRSMGLFDGQSRVNLTKEHMVCFDFSRLEEEFMRPLAMHVALSWIWEKFVKKDEKSRKMVICDEAWMYMKHKDSAKFLNDAARRGRKRNLSLGVVSQYPQEFCSDDGRAVLSSAATKFLLRQAPNDIPVVQEMFKLNDGQVRFINSCAVGETLILSEGQTGVFSTAIAVEASPDEAVLFNTDPEKTSVQAAS